MSNTQTTASFVGGIEGANVPGALATAPITSTANSTITGAPVLGGGINLVSAAASNNSYALPASWPLSAPIVVANIGAVSAVVYPPIVNTYQGVINGTTSYSAATNKAVAFYYLGLSTANIPQWAAVGA